jgi:hypothetical protein
MTRAARTLRTAAAAVACAAVLAPGVASGQDFGFRTTATPPNVSFTCGTGVPNLRYPVLLGLLPQFQPGTGTSSCTWTSVGTGGSLYVPGTGTVTAVQLPPLQAPGPMQVVVLRTVREITTDPGHPDLACCLVRALSQPFTVPPNTPSNVPVNLPVQVDTQQAVNPGDQQGADLLALSALSPSGQLPLLDLGDDNAAYASSVYYPAPTEPVTEFVQPGNLGGYVLLMSASWTPATGVQTPVAPGVAQTPAAGGGGQTPGGGGATPGGGGAGGGGGATQNPTVNGLTLLPTGLVTGNGVGIGRAANPPTARTSQVVTLNLGAARAARMTVLARGATKIPKGGTGRLTAHLTRAGKALLKKKKTIRATMTIVAVDAAGHSQTVSRPITLKRR